VVKATHKRLDTLIWDITHKEEDDTAVDLTGVSVNIRAKRQRDGYILFDVSDTDTELDMYDATNGKFRLVLDTSDFVVGDFVVDITYTLGSGVSSTETFGLMVIPNV